MLRRGKFNEPERWLVWLIAFALFAAGATGIGLAIARSEEMFGLGGGGLGQLRKLEVLASHHRQRLVFRRGVAGPQLRVQIVRFAAGSP